MICNGVQHYYAAYGDGTRTAVTLPGQIGIHLRGDLLLTGLAKRARGE